MKEMTIIWSGIDAETTTSKSFMDKHLSQTLYIVSELFPPEESATAYIMGEIAIALSSKYNVKVICGPEVYDVRKSINSTSNIKESIEIYRTKGTTHDKNTLIGKMINLANTSISIYNLCRRNIKKGDKVLMVTNPALMLPLMSHLKRKIGFTLNVLVHDIFPENTIPIGLKPKTYSLIKPIFDKAYSDTDLIIAIGRDMAEVLQKKAPNTKIKIIPNWSDIERIQRHPMKRYDKIKVQYAGNIGKTQGLEKILHNLPDDVELHIYGTGYSEEKLKKMNLQNVFFHGPYSRNMQDEILSDCDIALVALQDGMYGLGVPSKTYNIMASGRPILFIGPENSEIYRIVKENRLGYCGWPDSWNREELYEMGVRARKIAEENYSKQDILNRYLTTI